MSITQHTSPTQELLDRFGLRHGQFFAYYHRKNLFWFFNGVEIGFGDLRDEDVLHIAETLEEGEEFIGYSEHLRSGFAGDQYELPVIRIVAGNFSWPNMERLSRRLNTPRWATDIPSGRMG